MQKKYPIIIINDLRHHFFSPGKTITTLIFLVCLSLFANAQRKILNGQVLDEKQLPLIGAVIKIKGTNKATSTDTQGKFSLDRKSVV